MKKYRNIQIEASTTESVPLAHALRRLVKSKTLDERYEAADMIKRVTGEDIPITDDLSEGEMTELSVVCPGSVEGNKVNWQFVKGFALDNGLSLRDARGIYPEELIAWWRARQVRREQEKNKTPIVENKNAKAKKMRAGKNPGRWTSKWKQDLLAYLFDMPEAKPQEKVIVAVAKNVAPKDVARAMGDLRKAKWITEGIEAVFLTDQGRQEIRKRFKG